MDCAEIATNSRPLKGIVLAGGRGTRLMPATLPISKQLLPVYDKPMIYYPLSTLMLTGIRDILLIATPEDLPRFKRLLGEGQQWGIRIQYAVQDQPLGLAHAFIVAEDFIDGQRSALVLGDNIHYGANFSSMLCKASEFEKGMVIFAYRVSDPQRYGVIEFTDNFEILSIEEKPMRPKSNYAVTGLYFVDEQAPRMARELKPSQRGELEICDLQNWYLRQNALTMKVMDRGSAWLDTGTYDSMMDSALFVQTLERRQGIKIACPEEIAFRKGWISRSELIALAKEIWNSPYGEYLNNVASEFA